MSKPRRLFFDIETSPNLALIWRPGHKISVSYNSIVRERAIICVAWKWEGERKIQSLTWDQKQDDAGLLRKFVPVMHEADEIVAHNGDGGWKVEGGRVPGPILRPPQLLITN